MYRLSRSIGLITSLSLLLLMLASCRDFQAEEQIRANAQIQISANQAQAQRDISFNQANAAVGVANSQKEATVAVSNNQLAADKYKAEQATKQAAIWADKLPELGIIATFAVLAAIVLIYRGKIGLRRVDKEVLLLSPPSPPPSPLPSLKAAPPLQVTVEAQRRHALVAPGAVPGEWLLMLPDGRQLVMRPKQLMDGNQGGV